MVALSVITEKVRITRLAVSVITESLGLCYDG